MVRPSVPDPPELSDRLWDGFGGGYGWDVGANCGQTIPLMAKLFTRVTSFEPCFESFDYAREHYPDAELWRVAVSDHDGDTELAFPAPEQYQTGQLCTIGTPMDWAPKDWAKVPHVTVPCRTADSLAAELGAPGFMKVDTEGHEVAVLAGAKQILKSGRTSFLVEFHSQANSTKCRKKLEQAGYAVEMVRHPHYPPGSRLWYAHGWLRAFAPYQEGG